MSKRHLNSATLCVCLALSIFFLVISVDAAVEGFQQCQYGQALSFSILTAIACVMIREICRDVVMEYKKGKDEPD